MSEIKICHLYPDLLNLYGDRGNIIAIKKRCEWRGIEAKVENISLGQSFIPENYDIVFLGGGQDFEQEIIQADIIEHKKTEIINAIENDKIFLCICGGYQLLGKYYKTWDGKEIEFLDILDLWTVGDKERLIGNLAFEIDFLKNDNFDGTIVGFENHSGKTYLGEKLKPLGKVIKGHGNNGQDGFEGAVYKSVYCSYSHGSLLPKNPFLTDYLIEKALKQKYPDFVSLQYIDNKIEMAARNSLLKIMDI